MKTNPIVAMQCLLLVLFFNGCASKEYVYVPQKCLVEKPLKSEAKNCQALVNDLDFMQCVAVNYTNIIGDYQSLDVAFEGCK